MDKNQEGQIQKKQDASLETTHDNPVFLPAADIHETADAIEVVCDMPGVDQKDVQITLEDDQLTLSACQNDTAPKDMRVLSAGYRTGIFRRSFTVLANVDAAGIKAKLANGVLTVTLPKAEEAKPRRIEVEAG